MNRETKAIILFAIIAGIVVAAGLFTQSIRIETVHYVEVEDKTEPQATAKTRTSIISSKGQTFILGNPTITEYRFAMTNGDHIVVDKETWEAKEAGEEFTYMIEGD